MGSEVFGRTNAAFPPVWLSLATPEESSELPGLVQSAAESRTVIDISAHPALFGGFMRGSEAVIMGAGGSDIVHCPDEDSAANLIHAHLIETLCAIGREWLDFYFFRVRHPLEEYQITGAVRALDWAREEGHLKFIGLSAEAEPIVVVSAWQFHDAFQAVLLPNDLSANRRLIGMAEDRRAGIVKRMPIEAVRSDGKSLVTVRSAAEVSGAIRHNLVAS